MTSKPLSIERLQGIVGHARNAFGTHSVICAGGAPRDLLNGAPVKDIDIFVGLEPEDFGFKNDEETSRFERGARVLYQMLFGPIDADLNPTAFRLIGGNNPDYANLVDLIEMDVPGLPTIQVVGLEIDPVADVADYDFGLSQVFVTDSSLHMTQAYVDDKYGDTITYTAGDQLRSPAAIIRSKKRLERLLVKYPRRNFVGYSRLIVQASEAALILAQQSKKIEALDLTASTVAPEDAFQ